MGPGRVGRGKKVSGDDQGTLVHLLPWAALPKSFTFKASFLHEHLPFVSPSVPNWTQLRVFQRRLNAREGAGETESQLWLLGAFGFAIGAEVPKLC